MGFLYGHKLFEARFNETSRKSGGVFRILIMTSNLIFEISLIVVFSIFSRVLPEDCLIIPSPLSWYKPMLDGLKIMDISFRINKQIRSHTVEGPHGNIEIISIIKFGQYSIVVANNCLH